MIRLGIAISLVLMLFSCQKEKISTGENVSDTFFLENMGASMHVLVEGNTASHTFLIFVHGGPGTGSLFYNTEYITNNIENKYAAVYWDQRNAGASQGNANSSNLNLDQMTDDLRELILVLKHRYGQDISVFILGHSFGGLLTASFMTSGDNQSMVKGWIFADGSQDYPKNDTLTRQMLLTVGQQQLALNNHISEWKTIIDYCNNHPGNFTFDESMQLESYAADAETYFSEVKQIDIYSMIEEYTLNYKLPLTSYLFNYLYSSDAGLNKELAKTEFSSKLSLVTTPTLVLFGKYDFICPKEMGYDLFNRISSTGKKIAISPISGHNIMFQDESFFCREVDDFIAQYK